MNKSISTPAVVGLVAALVVLAGFVIYRSQPRLTPPPPMQAPPPMPTLSQGADGRVTSGAQPPATSTAPAASSPAAVSPSGQKALVPDVPPPSFVPPPGQAAPGQ